MAYDNHCEDCDKFISDDYERCYTCNEEYNDETVHLSFVDVVTQTKNAVRLSLDGDQSEIWLPKSETTLEDNFVFMPR